MYRAVIVDDDPWALIDIRKCFPFEKHSFEVIAECMNSEAALPIILKQRPELVITDICMAGASGLDLMRICRENGISSVFVVISGHDNFEFAREAIRYGAFYYMLKPVGDSEAEDVMERVALLLQKQPQVCTVETITRICDNDSFNQILAYMDENFSKAIYLEDISRKFYLNRTYICDLFQKRLGKTFTQYLTELRMKKTCELLADTDLSIGKISQDVGYDDYHYFNRVFKSMFGVTPMNYRKERCQPGGSQH